jgi:NADPH-dependent 2,4-dienoyl-CoA reductase/sulfur reductase-like enzyme
VVVEAAGQVAPRVLDRDLASVVEEELVSNGVRVVKNARVVGFRASGGRARAVETEKGLVEGDMFVLGVGVEPDTTLARMLGARIGETGAVWVDERMRTSLDGVYAVGDSVEHTDLVTGRRVWRPFAQVANKMGYVAGTVIAGGDARFRGSVGTSAFRVFDVVAARTGLSRGEAEKLGYNVVEASLRGATRAHYMPGGSRISLKVVADADTGRLLGAQAVGRSESVFWRINVVAGLLTVGGTVWDLFYSDVGYAPPLAPVWDPLVVSARLLARELGGRPGG